MSMQRILVGAAIALALAFVASRWRWTSLPTGRVEVTGTVYLDGRPLTGHDGLVGMGSTSNQSESVAGWIDSGGRYRVDKTRARDGVAPGRYRVIVSVHPAVSSSAPPSVMVPAKYEDPAKSGLTVEVTSQPRQTIDLQLKSR